MRKICQKHGLILPITITNSNILVIFSFVAHFTILNDKIIESKNAAIFEIILPELHQ